MSRRWLPYLQLVRLPNVFTAMADIFLGALATSALPERWLRFVLLLLASSALYCSGMVWNDYFDIERDKRQRPFRPLPSGKVSVRTAFALACILMVVGIALAVVADFHDGQLRWYSIWIAILLSGSILFYDGWLKRTWAGPLAMGSCRFLNVLLGISVYPVWRGSWGLVLALVVGVYIIGVTWFARTEAEESKRSELGYAAGVMLLALLLALVLPSLEYAELNDETNLPQDYQVFLGQLLFPYLIFGFGLFIGLRVWRAIRHPVPDNVQRAVKRCVLGLVLLDAVLTTAFVGPLGLALIALLAPAVSLGRWVYST